MLNKINNTRVIPVSLKIILTFTIFLLVSNLTSNYINLRLNQALHQSTTRQLLAEDLRDLYSFSNTQFQIYEYDQDLDTSLQQITRKGINEINSQKGIFLGISPDGILKFESSKLAQKFDQFRQDKILHEMLSNKAQGKEEGNIYFQFNNEAYFGIYKFNQNWNVFMLRAEELNEFQQEAHNIFKKITWIITAITLLFAIIGIFLLRHLLHFLKVITNNIMQMVTTKELHLINLDKAPPDDITFMGYAFNALSDTTNTLVNIFKKFTNRDVVARAYRDQEVRLEGTNMPLAVLFTDIRNFTSITEVLGYETVKLLNLHYDKAIKAIAEEDGIIGSIVGDALLAVFGVFGNNAKDKSCQAILSAYRIHAVAQQLRIQLDAVREQIVKQNGSLSEEEQKVYDYAQLDVGVGLDCGDIFYGTVGSSVRMTNTVIGDNVNNAARLESLTRIYDVPVICSKSVKEDVETNITKDKVCFVEIDTVQVKGKTTAHAIYWPILNKDQDDDLRKALRKFSEAQFLYYSGDWKAACDAFSKIDLPLARVFEQRTQNNCPADWSGTWIMQNK